MAEYYLDIETTGLEPESCKIITIQYQELERNTGKPAGRLNILKEWESSEKDIIRQFMEDSDVMDPYEFSFIPVGYNLNFEHNFLKTRSETHGLGTIDILNHPFIDLRAFGVIMNRGEFKGSGLDKITAKPIPGINVPIWYENGQYDTIVKYIEDETKAFLQLNEWLYREMPLFLERFKRENNISDGPSGRE
ncbi:Uncharacterised protein [uncultured archaeon]|nr:Uncharacterised protein [uncultured archaeon]